MIEELASGSAAVFGSSGGAVSALALAVRHPSLLTAVVAHEPPLAVLLDDCEAVRIDTDRMIATYRSGDRVGYWRQFLASAGIDAPPEVFNEWFGEPPTGRDLDDERFAVERMERSTTFWTPPVDAIATFGRPIVVGVGEQSAGQFCDRTARALCKTLGIEPVTFPGDHTGLVEHPAAFAHTLRAVLDGPTP